MSKKLLLTIFLMISIIVSGCVIKEEFLSDTGIFSKTEKGMFDDLEISIELEKTTFNKGDNIRILFILKNKGTNLIHLDDKGFDAGIYDSNGVFITYVRPENDISRYVNLGQDVSFIESIDWHNDLEPGTYSMVGYLRAEITYKDSDTKIEPYVIKTEPLTIVIE